MRAFSPAARSSPATTAARAASTSTSSGPDLAQLYATADAAYRKAQEMFDRPQVNSEPSSLSLDQPLLEIRPDWERLAELGFTAQGFGFAVAALSDGAFVDEFILGDDKIDIASTAARARRRTSTRCAGCRWHAPSGAVLPLESLAELRDTVDTDVIRRVDGRRTVTLSIVPPRAVALETAVGASRTSCCRHCGPRARAAGDVARGLRRRRPARRDARVARANFAIATLLSYLLLVAIFTHWGWPLMILVTVPLGLAGGISAWRC
jgi:multidrug efflux pump subunit AcrB